jgi:hypothetical protein
MEAPQKCASLDASPDPYTNVVHSKSLETASESHRCRPFPGRHIYSSGRLYVLYMCLPGNGRQRWLSLAVSRLLLWTTLVQQPASVHLLLVLRIPAPIGFRYCRFLFSERRCGKTLAGCVVKVSDSHCTFSGQTRDELIGTCACDVPVHTIHQQSR